MNITNTSKITVVLPGEATTRETFAAEELVKYLSQIFDGICVSLASDHSEITGDKILIGGPERNAMTAYTD